MDQYEINQKILDELKQIRVDINIIKEKLPEEEPLMDVEEQLKIGLEELKQGKIVKLN